MLKSFPHVSDDELDQALNYAKKKHGVTLARDTLRILMNEIADRRARTGESFEAARSGVLTLKLPQRDKNETARRNAYSAACGKIGSIRSVRARATKKLAAQRAAARIPTSIDANGQYSFVLSSH